MSASIKCTWAEFKVMGKEFLDLLPGSTEEQAENGFKAIGLAYFGMEGSHIELVQAEMLLKILARKKLEHELTMVLNPAAKPEAAAEDKYPGWPELATVKLQWAYDYTTGWGRRGADGEIRPIYGDDTREPLDMNCWIIIAEREAAGKKGGAA